MVAILTLTVPLLFAKLLTIASYTVFSDSVDKSNCKIPAVEYGP